jgi:hypothetical protein
MAQSSSWKDLAEKKRNAIFNSIPAKWHLEKSKLPSNEQQKDVTGYIQQFLSKRELEITETDVVGIAKETSSGNWTAVEVAEAFCHRASLAHQLVSDGCWRFYNNQVLLLMSMQNVFWSCNGVWSTWHRSSPLIVASRPVRSWTDFIRSRPIACTKHFSMRPSPMPRHSTSISPRTRNLSDLYTVFQSV